MAHSGHPVFGRYSACRQPDPEGMHTDFVGVRTSQEFGVFAHPGSVEGVPPVDEDYLEWIDILESAEFAKEKFVMVELGAGYGRWGVRGALAAKQAGVKEIFIGFAEAEPVHVRWLKEHVANNRISAREFKLYETAVSDHDGTVDFYVAMPDGSEGNNPAAWYGQAKAKDYEVVDASGNAKDGPQNKNTGNSGETYEGHPVKTFASGWKAVEVRQTAATKLLRDFKIIDLLDMDVQGEETKIVRGAIGEINKRVKRLHIGTHGRDIEHDLFTTMKEQGWVCIRSYPCQSTTPTPYGDVNFVDGMQTWLNPRLIDVSAFPVEQVYVPEKPRGSDKRNYEVTHNPLRRWASRVKKMLTRKAA